MSEMIFDFSRPCRGDGVVPFVHALAIVLCVRVTHRQIELDDLGLVVGEHVGANGSPQVGKFRFLAALARNEDEIGRIDRADRGQRELLGIAAADADQ